MPFQNRTGVVIGGEEIPTHLQSLVSSSSLKPQVSSPAKASAHPESIPSVSGPDGSSNNPASRKAQLTNLLFDEEAKLVYGVIFSLRNMIKKLAGRDEPLHCYTTSTYTLHLLTTPTNQTFVLLTSPMTESLRNLLKSLWRGPWLDFVVRNPLVSIDSAKSRKGIDNEMFRRSVENLMRSAVVFN